VRIELEFARILPENHSFQGGNRSYFFQIGLFRQVEGTHVYQERKPSALEAGAYAALFPIYD
jgi:hypothetical protein